MGKPIPPMAKVVAYNDAIDALEALHTDHDTEDELRARKWLADKLDRECSAMLRRAPVDRTGAGK